MARQKRNRKRQDNEGTELKGSTRQTDNRSQWITNTNTTRKMGVGQDRAGQK